MENKNPSSLSEIETSILINPIEAESELRKILENTQDTQSRMEILSLIGYSLVNQSKLKKAKEIYFEIYDVSIKNNFIELEAEALNGLAMIETDLGELQKAEIHAKNALTIFQKLELAKKEAKIANLIGVIYYYQDKLDDSLKFLSLVPDLIQDTDVHLNLQSLANKGLVYQAQGQLKQAKDVFSRALRLAQQEHFFHWACIIANNLANTEKNLGHFKEAESLYVRGIEIALKSQDLRSLALLNVGYANFSLELGKIDRTYQLFMKSINIYKDIDDPIGYILALYGIAQYWMMKGQYNKSRDFLLEALEIIETSKSDENYLDIMILLAEIEFNLGYIQNAYNYMKLVEDLSRKENTQAAHTQILILRSKIAMDKSNFHEAEFFLNEAIWNSKNQDMNTYAIASYLLLARIQLLQYDPTFKEKNEDLLQEALKQIEKAQKIADASLSKISSVQILIMKGILKSLNNEPLESISLINLAIEQTMALGLTSYEQVARETLMIIDLKNQEPINYPHIDSLLLQKAISKLKNITLPFDEALITENDFEDLFLVAYKIDEIIGPMIVESIKIDLKDEQKNAMVLHAGSLFSITLGQGQQYHQGLFGPLPFGENSSYALVYAKTIADRTQKEKRTHGRAYFLFSLVYPRKMNLVFYDRKKLSRIFENVLDEIKEAEDISKNLLEKMRFSIFEEFIKKK